MTSKELIISITLSTILIAESIWSVNYLAKAKSASQKSTSFEQVLTTEENSATPTKGPKLALSSQKQTIKVGEELKIKLLAKPEDKGIQALDALISFDKEKLSLLQILPSLQGNGVEYPQNKFNNEKGQIALSLILNEKPLLQETTIAEIIFSPLQAGETSIVFDFEQGKTTDSNAVLYNEGEDSLTGVENLKISIESGL